MQKPVVGVLLLCSLLLNVTAFGRQPLAADREEFVGPFPSWANAKSDFGAVGDGQTDDTAALQKAIKALGGAKSAVLFIPEGTYRITAGLTMVSSENVSIIGADPATTVIKWDGPGEGTMLFCNGVRYSKFSRLTWDGGGKKVTGVFHEWDGHTPGANSGNEHSDEIFRDLAFGIRAGKPHFMDAECEVLRCKFLRVSVAGVRIQSFNALDWFIRDCEFEDCAVGVTNDPGAGHFHVYRSIFRRSTVADITLRNAGYFGIRHNLSIGSSQFLDARDIGGWAVQLTVQGNTVIDTKQKLSIVISNPGPTILMDNVIRSRPEVTQGPVVRMAAGLDGEYVAVGNTFTIPQAIAARQRLMELETTVVPAASIQIPELPGTVTPPYVKRTVIEVTASTNATVEIQAALDRAAALQGKRPVVHLATGDYRITRTLTIPAGSDVQVTGDGYATRINWAGETNGLVFSLPGPVRATFRDLAIGGNGKAAGIVATRCDQPGARVFADQLGAHGSHIGLLVDGLENTDVSLYTFYHSGNNGVSVRVVGGPKAAAGKSTATRTAIFGGASSNSPFNYDVDRGGRLMAQDIWYEGSPSTFMRLTGSGTFTLSGAQISPGRPGPNAAPTDPGFAGVTLDHFKGRASFLSAGLGTRVMVLGDEAASQLLLLGVEPNDPQEVLVTPPPKPHVALAFSRRFASQQEGDPPTRSLPDQGNADPVWLLQMLEQVRGDLPRPLTVIPEKVTDLRFYRVMVSSCTTGVQLRDEQQ